MRLLSILLVGVFVLGGALSSRGQEGEAAPPVVVLNSVEPTPPFSRPVDPDLYLIRPGDEIQITFVKSQLDSVLLIVNPEGRIVDRTLGVHDLAFKTLSQAREILGTVLKRLYNIPGITIDITRSRLVSIVVTGAVAQPGTYEVFTYQKVSDVINLAGGVLSEASRRWILFTGGPNPIKVDLDRTVFMGDPEADPGVYAGRAIHVPSRVPNTVHVTGEVLSPREIELVPGDDLKTILALAGGLRRTGDSTAIRIVSPSGMGSRENLKGGDIIVVPAKVAAPEDRIVFVFGAVGDQGIFSYREGMTISGAVQAAGGLLPDANPNLATLFRRPKMDSRGRFTYERYPVSGALSGEANSVDFRLEPDDSLFVPFKVGFVKVAGEVVNPGYFAFQEGKDVLFYVRTAGGFLPTANKDEIMLFNPVSRVTSLSSPGVRVHDGSVITVQLREELKK